ncbi:exonuclease [candidate division MSBL1 archaeon SCGC-AAA261F17]|uniref:Exosome complex component Rrp41 n=4 Tax=candidate division MSBL1 TaxID=215777 RepID=A0A133V1G4_9EURY|nr:exonuclease [candidate division MSBL1 archaeon SCGC-AAA261C02]KXB02320.1 exonuclease [candidate division MSBL1 archaeon SCGC-AAA261F17]KXB04173.1 exonuclease [candidate division MSBL1 archaeon SCGC-AAA261G05]KXB04385.1 exonuclease [candidate division MSBL1 archaeon SCGC-AAA261O19]
MEEPEQLITDGKRIDDRKPEEMRPLKIEAGVLKKADGSAYLELGKNKVLAAVYGPRELHPRHLQRPDRAVLTCRYDMAPFSVEERARPGPSRRSREISKVSREALEPALFLQKYPRAGIEVSMEILQAGAGTRTAGISAASVALADAGIPMRDLVASLAAGKADDTIVLDLGKEEDQLGEADMPIAYMPQKEQITLLQMDGNFSPDEFDEALELAIEGCKQVYEKQREALSKKYAKEEKK